jgi:GNAT superfamily N-acetyltransferase
MTPEEAEALHFLVPLSEDYPKIGLWYRQKVVPGLRDGTRFLVRVVRDDQLVGLGIGKNEPDERKICTVRVAPSHASRGIGVRIFDSLLKWLDVDDPHLTVSDAKLPLFERIFDYYGFDITSSQPGFYVPQRCEFGLNEPRWGRLGVGAHPCPSLATGGPSPSRVENQGLQLPLQTEA